MYTATLWTFRFIKEQIDFAHSPARPLSRRFGKRSVGEVS